MGKIYEASNKRAREEALRAAVNGVAEAGEPAAEEFDFVSYSLHPPAGRELGPARQGQASGQLNHRGAAAPARESAVDPQRVDQHLVTLLDPCSPAAGQYDRVAVTLIAAAADRPCKRLLLASAHHGEGRTCVTLNLAGALARAGRRVLVLESDLGRPAVLRLLGLEAEAGLAEVLTREPTPGAAILRVTPAGFDVLPSRARAEHAAELLASPRLRDLLDACDPDYDFILFDSSPLLAAGGARLLVGLTDATLLVVRPGRTRPEEMAKAIAPLTEENLLGVVINRAAL